MTAFFSYYLVDCHVIMLKRFFPPAFSGRCWIIYSNANIPRSLTLRNKYSSIKNKCQDADYLSCSTLRSTPPSLPQSITPVTGGEQPRWLVDKWWSLFKNDAFCPGGHHTQGCSRVAAALRPQKEVTSAGWLLHVPLFGCQCHLRAVGDNWKKGCLVQPLRCSMEPQHSKTECLASNPHSTSCPASC